MALLQQEESKKGTILKEWSMKEVVTTETFQGSKLLLCLTKKTKNIKQKRMLRIMKICSIRYRCWRRLRKSRHKTREGH